MKGIKIKYLIILALAVFDLVALFILFLATNIIPVLIVAILLLCVQYPIMKQQISSEKYYRTIIEKEDQHLGNELLIKMFEMRMTNIRHTIFALIGLFLMLAIAIEVNTKTLLIYLNSPHYWAILAGACLLGVLILLYCSARIDREAIEELDELFKAMKRLDQLKKESDMDSVRHIEKSRTQQEEESDEKDCPLSTADWVMFLSSEINELRGIQSAIISAITAFMVGLLGVMVGYLAAGFAFISINIDFMPMVSSSIYSLFKFILCAAVLLVFFEILVMLITRKRINRHKEIIRKIIYGKTDSNKIREEWEKSKNEQKELKEDEGNSKMVKTIKIFFGCVFVALLIAPAMLVVPPLSVAAYILGIPVLFAVACILMDKLKENEEAKNKIKDGLLDVLIGIISGLVASYLTWVLLTSKISIPKISTPLLFSIIATLLVVVFSFVVIWVFVSTKWSH